MGTILPFITTTSGGGQAPPSAATDIEKLEAELARARLAIINLEIVKLRTELTAIRIRQAVKVIVLAAVALFLLTHFAKAQQSPQQVFRDADGRTIGTGTTSGNQTTFRDAGGRTTGTATTNSQGVTTFRDSRGSVTGTTTAPFGKDYRR